MENADRDPDPGVDSRPRPRPENRPRSITGQVVKNWLKADFQVFSRLTYLARLLQLSIFF